ncbi:hypothetical protein FACS1894199_11640 [Bacteroidia bacterium]|nr:hypothetical protein FACS1894199_11640 [Bacteroidia bacterium]
MKHTNQLLLANLLLVVLFFTSCTSKQAEWTDLLDENLTQWRTYLSFVNMTSTGEPALNEDGTVPTPIGYDVNQDNVFSVIKENDELVLSITGKIYGCIVTKQSFKNYHLQLQYKFGSAKYPPRENKAMDSGILYHSRGEAGVHWHTWMTSQEFQVMETNPGGEGISGDYYSMGAQVNLVGDETVKSRYPALGDFTNPVHEWTTLDLYCYEGKSLHIVNGRLAMALENSSYKEGTEVFPLVEGKIQLQSEAAEVYFKNIKIQSISELPKVQ